MNRIKKFNESNVIVDSNPPHTTEIPTFKELLEEQLVGKRVRIVLGHVDNGQWIEGDVTGFEAGRTFRQGGDDDNEIYILLENVTGNNKWLEHSIESGNYNRHYLRLGDRITII